MEDLIKGIDVSRWQGTNINWQLIKNAGYNFVFIKVTDGTAYKQAFIDGAKIQATGALAAGLKIGYYHFAKPIANPDVFTDAQQEAEYFKNTLLAGFPTPNFPLVLDFEDEGSNLNNSDAEVWIQQFVGNIVTDFSELLLYSYKGFLDAHLNKTHALGSMPLWLAKYPKVVDLTKPPQTPVGWNDWQIWQFSEKGTVNGISGANVDLNVMKKSFFDKF